MSLFAAVALTALTSLWGGQGQESSPSAEQQHKALLAETRDATWADQAERRLDAIYAPVRSVGPISVTCRRTLCEVAGEIAPGDAAAATAALQSAAINDRVLAAGFAEQTVIKFAADAGQPPRFVTYWRATR